ncbi:hypothetical protein BDY19DRAFT_162006 [Irpex rosettiformis]|uniref:Uncharacterized protein n=1 Tax=Irpex rosettiformis TaxID=378272 RepID=A0ACB8U488_9APHY|nr:hypothetical protein BDY19DRAFT_162006 [Irpex rosettiformis]
MAHPLAGDFIGPCFIIICFVLMLYGVFCAQVYFYWTTYKDHPVTKSLVVILIVLETVHVAFCIHAVYDYLVIDHADPSAFTKVIWSVGASILTEVKYYHSSHSNCSYYCSQYLISGMVQGWYIYRIWRLYPNGIVAAFLSVLWVARMGVAFRYDSYLFQYSEWKAIESDKHYWIVLNAAFAMNVIVDLAITFVLSIHLYLKRSWAIKQSTKNIVATLINLAVGAGVLNLIASISLFATSNLSKNSITYGGIMELEAKLYANSILVMLNARRGIAEKAAANTDYTLDLSRILTHPCPAYMLSVAEVRKEDIVVAEDLWGEGTPEEKQTVHSSSTTVAQAV